jgi:hypothetical protein
MGLQTFYGKEPYPLLWAAPTGRTWKKNIWHTQLPHLLLNFCSIYTAYKSGRGLITQPGDLRVGEAWLLCYVVLGPGLGSFEQGKEQEYSIFIMRLIFFAT